MDKKGGKNKVREALDAAEVERKREMFKQRLELARQGVKSYRDKKVGDAVTSFYTYLRLLEDFKGVGENGLTPQLFDPQKELAEILLLLGVYWDLAKMYDRTSSPEKQREFMRYLEKYVAFAKGQPHEHIAADSIRKHILRGRPQHKEAFMNAYRALGGGKCFVVHAVMDLVDPDTIDRLQGFRDQRLRQSRMGQALIRVYYRVGPILARAVVVAPKPVRHGIARVLDYLGRKLRS
ncbi:MAG: hypothetical protein JNL01_03645 [Bdellovibrionales bacterium]|nr:hypothetical protein [Bdellovibrionales bacterium]